MSDSGSDRARAWREATLTEPDSPSFHVSDYNCRLRSWNGCIWRDIRMSGMRGMSLQSPKPHLTRLAFFVKNGAARAHFRTSPTLPARADGSPHGMCLVPAGAIVWAYSEPGGSVELASLAFDVQELSESLGTRIPDAAFSTLLLNFSNERMWLHARRLVEESRAPREFSALYFESLAMTLVIDALRLDRTHYSQSKTGGLSQKQLRTVTDFIEENIAANVSLSQLAKLTGLSPSHFAHAFKRSTGRPPHRWRLEARVRRAQELLTSTTLSLSEVGEEIGFSDQAHFTRVFRRIAGMTPRAWRSDHS